MTQNAVTPSTPPTPSGTGWAWPDQPRPETPSPPLGGGLRDGVEAAGPLEHPTPSRRTGLELTPAVPCSGCPDCHPFADDPAPLSVVSAWANDQAGDE